MVIFSQLCCLIQVQRKFSVLAQAMKCSSRGGAQWQEFRMSRHSTHTRLLSMILINRARSFTPLLANYVLFSALSIIGMCLKYTQYRNYSGVFWDLAVLSPRQWARVGRRVYVIHRPTLLFLSYHYKCTGCTTFADNEPWCFSAQRKATHWAQRRSEMPREPISGNMSSLTPHLK